MASDLQGDDDSVDDNINEDVSRLPVLPRRRELFSKRCQIHISVRVGSLLKLLKHDRLR